MSQSTIRIPGSDEMHKKKHIRRNAKKPTKYTNKSHCFLQEFRGRRIPSINPKKMDNLCALPALYQSIPEYTGANRREPSRIQARIPTAPTRTNARCTNTNRLHEPALYNRHKFLYLSLENQLHLKHKIPLFLAATLAATLWILAGPHLTNRAQTVFAQSFETAKYGNDFLSVGSGARALGMGGAHAAIASDATAAYWNPAGLAQLSSTDLAYMHSERFSGIVQYDYAAIAYPIRGTGSVVALSLFRQSVDDIANTLNAWDRERNLPRLRASDYIEFFSVSDLAILLSYASTLGNGVRWGVNTKIVNHRLGPFAQGWGYSLDAGLQADLGDARLAVHLMDLTTMLKFWSVDEAAFGDFEAIYDEAIPSGQNERVLPVLKLGAGYLFRFDELLLTTAADLDLRFENRQAYHLSLGAVSFEPHLGAELAYRGRLMVRAGATNITTNPDGSLFVSPTLGAGMQIQRLAIDYGFANFAGASAVLGQTHRISLRIQL